MKKNKRENMVENAQEGIFVPIVNIEPYKGIIVEKNTKLFFANKNVVQSIENLVLTTAYTVKTERFLSKTKVKLKLREGEKLLLEESGKGWFSPTGIRIGTMDDLQKEVDFMNEQLAKIPKE